MKRSSIGLFLLALTAILFAAAPASAQATRTWVSGVGDDANPCSRTAPCKTFAGAISKTSAGGEIDALDPGGFGALTITKSITIDGGTGNIAGVLVSGTNGIVIQAAATDVVTLRNLDINGLGAGSSGASTPGITGVRIISAQGAQIENCKIYGFSSYGVDLATSTANSTLNIVNSVITDNLLGGVVAEPAGVSASANVVKSTLSRNKVGVRAQDQSIVNVYDSTISDNLQGGAVAQATSLPAQLNLKTAMITGNQQNGVLAFGTGALVTIANSGVYQNVTGIHTNMGGVVDSYGNNQVTGNGANGAPTATIPSM